MKKIVSCILLIGVIFVTNTKLFYASTIDTSNLMTGYAVKLITVEPDKRASITNYDVNAQGQILICTDISDSTKKDIYIYSEAGVFEYGYSISSYGKVKAKWSGENVKILWVRDNIVVEVDPSGKIVQSMEITVDERSEYAFSEIQICKGKEYRIEAGDKKSLLNSRLVSIDDNNNEITIYQTNINYMPFILSVCFSLFLVIAVIVTMIRYWIKINRKQFGN